MKKIFKSMLIEDFNKKFRTSVKFNDGDGYCEFYECVDNKLDGKSDLNYFISASKEDCLECYDEITNNFPGAECIDLEAVYLVIW